MSFLYEFATSQQRLFIIVRTMTRRKHRRSNQDDVIESHFNELQSLGVKLQLLSIIKAIEPRTGKPTVDLTRQSTDMKIAEAARTSDILNAFEKGMRKWDERKPKPNRDEYIENSEDEESDDDDDYYQHNNHQENHNDDDDDDENENKNESENESENEIIEGAKEARKMMRKFSTALLKCSLRLGMSDQ
jgi:TATA-binding protein-associated factor Taf7